MHPGSQPRRRCAKYDRLHERHSGADSAGTQSAASRDLIVRTAAPADSALGQSLRADRAGRAPPDLDRKCPQISFIRAQISREISAQRTPSENRLNSFRRARPSHQSPSEQRALRSAKIGVYSIPAARRRLESVYPQPMGMCVDAVAERACDRRGVAPDILTPP